MTIVWQTSRPSLSQLRIQKKPGQHTHRLRFSVHQSVGHVDNAPYITVKRIKVSIHALPLPPSKGNTQSKNIALKLP